MPIRAILDLAEEEVALRSGLLITDHDVFSLLESTPMQGWVARLNGDPGEVIGIRPEFFEDITRALRAAVGNLPDASPAHVSRHELLKILVERRVDPAPIMQAFLDEWNSGKYDMIGEEACRAVSLKCGVPEDVVNMVFLMIAEHLDRSARVLSGAVQTKDWDQSVPLSDLFETESIPRGDAALLDQRYIDFLAAQPGKLQEIHWRNFERLTAEFFDRQGYEAKLGPGTKDGGIDVRVWPKGRAEGPPLLVIQCKRYAKNRLVEVENIKSLWADLIFEGAEQGLVATTSRITPGGKRIVSARKYPLEFAEAKKVSEWVRTMWRHSWRVPTKTKGVGIYLLPPFYPIRPGDLDFLKEPTRDPSKRAVKKKPTKKKRR